LLLVLSNTESWILIDKVPEPRKQRHGCRGRKKVVRANQTVTGH
jgi:hypothetical protein